MLIIYVELGLEVLFEEIVNLLWKFKKVVVIMGVGISINLGILVCKMGCVLFDLYFVDSFFRIFV